MIEFLATPEFLEKTENLLYHPDILIWEEYMKNILAVLMMMSFAGYLLAQGEYPEPISGNTFLIEEAFNQDARVVQHILKFSFTRPSDENLIFFAQEWPLFSHDHQIGFSFSYFWLKKDENPYFLFGTLTLDYRYQLLDDGNWAAMAPRISLVVPHRKNYPYGNIGYQLNMPVSKRVHDKWIVHVNAGVMLQPKVDVNLPEKKNIYSYHAGAGLFWLLHPKFNITLEWLSEFRDEYDWDEDWDEEIKKNKSIHWINPGVRFAFRVGPVEFVPGFCVPLQVHGKKKPKTAYLSVSMEHPF